MFYGVDEIVRSYAKGLAGLSYASIASIILELEDVDLAHRTLRRRVAAYSPEDEPDDITGEFTTASGRTIRFNRETGDYSVIENNLGKSPKILVFDVETAPLKGWAFKAWREDITPKRVTNDWFCLGWAAKWLGSNELMSTILTPEEVKREDDLRIMLPLWELVDQADIVIAHNGKKFDVPKINWRFLVHGMMPPSSYQVIDTKVSSAREFGATSNSLDFLTNHLGLGRKLHTDWELWDRCMNGEPEALRSMQVYNEQDVRALEELYIAIRPWIKSHPNIGVYMDSTKSVCPNCGSDHIKYDGGFYYTQVNKYSTFRCMSCGASGHDRHTALSVDQRRPLVTTCAR